MKRDIWSDFGVAPGDPADINLLGVDNGAGNCCVAVAESILGELSVRRHLFFDAAHQRDTLYTMFSYSETQEYIGIEAMHGRGDCAGRSPVFVNFKRPPQGDWAKQKYNGDFDNPDYETLMRRFFQRLVRDIFACNPDLLNKPRTVLFVGRPASQLWEQCDLAYQKLLGKDLDIDGYDGKLDIVVYSEAQAALAYEYSQHQIAEQEAALILDCGSSTFDAVLVRGRAIAAEYSRQLGAGMLEELMLDAILAGEDESALSWVDARLQMRAEKSRHIVGAGHIGEHLGLLRKKKEDFFGVDGENGDRENLMHTISLMQEQKITKNQRILDDTFMHKVVHDIPIRVQDSYTDTASSAYAETDYPSFYAAVAAFIQETHRLCTENGASAPRVILTGGASVMPFIRTLVQHSFGKNAFGQDAAGQALDRPKNPAFSVGEGLAFMGYVEFLKKNALNDAKNLLASLLLGARNDIQRCVRDAFVDASWESLIGDLNVWCHSDKWGKTLGDGIRGDGLPFPAESIREKLQIALEKQGILKRISQEMDKRFAALFPGARLSFDFQVDARKVTAVILDTKALHKVDFDLQSMFGFFRAFFISIDTPVEMTKRAELVRRLQDRKSEVRAKLSQQLWTKSEDAADKLVAALQAGMTSRLSDYIEAITPYFVESCGG